MALKSCMNDLCGASTSIEWKNGWVLRSGGFANLCDKCGSAYEQSVFCDIFHSNESGWRECTSCGKSLHCGCIASRCLFELLESRGIICTSCAKKSGLNPIIEDQKPNGSGIVKGDAGQFHSITADNQLSGVGNENLKLIQLNNNAESIGLGLLLQLHNDDSSKSLGQMKQEEIFPPAIDIGSSFLSNTNQTSNGSVQAVKPTISKANISETSPSISLGGSLGNQNFFPGSVVDEKGKMSSVLQQASKSLHLLPKPPKPVLATGLKVNASMVPQIRVARPPVEGRGRNQLLPRYWPRITDQELQQISGDSNSTIVPLFEKVLSASDAGRIGRLVLPKACAEAYFPPISQPEGLPLRIQDVKGKDWVFQFRFWPNNNSRMYVLEGVTPCMQSMQLQAGDTVIFSRMDPEGKLVMGFRKATNNAAGQETLPSAIPNGTLSSESFFSGVFENLPIISGYSGLLQSLKGSTDPHLNALSKHLSSTGGDLTWNKSGKHEDMIKEGLLLPSMLIPERKRTRNIGSKSKRLLIDSQDALELKLTWEEAQDLLRPPPSIKPSVVTIEDHDFEEYDEPPVFGKKSIFAVRSTGGQEQWAQCDSCSKWRRLPVDVLLPPKWKCADNNWNQSRSSCSAPDELSPRELENLLRLNRDFKKRRIAAFQRPTPEPESSSGLDALANAAILGDNVDNSVTTSVATTTKHPRHRPGCSCIVCIQPPSGKGKHKPTCTCVVCMTVKRRFKTLTMRKKKRQSEREAEMITRRNQQAWGPGEEAEVDSSTKHVSSSHLNPSENEARSVELESKSQSANKLVEASKGQIDLNCDPDREDDLQLGPNGPSMTSLVQVATLPLEAYLKENGLTNLVYEQQGNSAASNAPPQSMSGNGEGETQDNGCFPLATEEPESKEEENGETGSNGVDEKEKDKDPQ
ncbi:B3 domain-containing transcription repressor VAL2 [Hibiscus syriacus]|uniref:B3 domain-containing transcription repressor VAL2 n=1 Tax=Hibiscus syriacus TaxID=106335 RepID=A0A6A2ZSW0_HIBSY|nr:B3 domain-containing transcription repressor VAL2-like [Hibiscus syriacus]XP_039010665.1 B3 domain-containing transcription repressor VAL2-like [Hibiscus syriacus]KAE8694998.1 B3 domain-containing transcription repressor VAL2 [Hibiscus syriacus]